MEHLLDATPAAGPGDGKGTALRVGGEFWGLRAGEDSVRAREDERYHS